MSNDAELERSASIVEGEIVEDDPAISADEARDLLETAFAQLNQGVEHVQSGLQLLVMAYQRQAWRPLGFASWSDCLNSGNGTFHTALTPAAREQLLISLRNSAGGVMTSYRAMSEALGVSHSTLVRDMSKARKEGRVAEEPTEVVSRNGAVRAARRPAGGHRRVDLFKSWRNTVDDATRKIRNLGDMCLDDRYAGRREDLARATRGDLQRAHDQLTAILNDFDLFTNGEQ